MPRQERSAGVVLFRDDNVDGTSQRVYLLLDYGRHWDYPKGHVEDGEKDLEAALRELREETGIADAQVIDGFAREITYYFRGKQGKLIRKAVWFCTARTAATDVKLSHEHVGFEFLDYDQAIRRLTYPTARTVLREAHAFLNEKIPSSP